MKICLAEKEHADRPGEGGAAGKGQELHAHERHAMACAAVWSSRIASQPGRCASPPAPVDEHSDADDQQHEGVEVERVDHVGARVDPDGLQERGEEDGRSSDGRDALGTVGEVDGLSRLLASTRMTSPKPRVTRAR